MGTGHGHRLYRHGDTVVHRLPAQCKIVAMVMFMLIVVATPPEQAWAFAAYAALLAAIARLAHVPASFIVRRLVVELPFVTFAVLLPFVARGPSVDVLGISLSQSGLLAAWSLLAKATLGVTSSILLAATTDARELIVAMQRLRVPNLLVEITSFMARYADVVTDELRRMRIARESRGFHARHVGHLRVIARSAGALFIRSYERGERVHLAMLSRGYHGTMPLLDPAPVGAAAWRRAAVLPVAATAIAVLAWLMR